MPAPTRRSPFPWRACAACAALSRSRISSASASSAPEKDDRDRGDRGGGRGGGEPLRTQPELPACAGAPRPAGGSEAAIFTAAAPGTRRRCFCARRSSRAMRIAGPALIIEPHQTVVVEPGWQAEIDARRTISCSTRMRRAARSARAAKHADPVLLEVFNNLFMSVAEQMGYALQNTARSVNIKERLDFSCAIFDAQGSLVANAPHMPVHLGSHGPDRRDDLARGRGQLQPGDVYMLNAPYNGGTHLPDITVVTPVFARARAASSCSIVASRGHHADIGGIAPGSMSPQRHDASRRKASISTPFKLVEGGRFREDASARASDRRPLPGAQPGAEHRRPEGAGRRQRTKGVAELRKMVAHYGLDVGRAPIWATCRTMRRRLCAASSPARGRRASRSRPTRAARVEVAITVDREQRTATVDFTGTSAQCSPTISMRRSRSRAPPCSMCSARLVDDDIPMNAGCLRPIEIVVPEGLDAEAALSRGRRRRQCRDEPDHRELPLRRARRLRLGAGHDEQSHLRQRRAFSITRRSAPARRRAAASTARPPCTCI